MIPIEKLAQLEAEHGDAAFQKKLAALKAEHGECTKVETKAGTCIFKKPSRPIWMQFQSRLIAEKTRADATTMLARACVVYPSRDEFEQYLENYPAIVGSCASAVIELAGGGDAEVQNLD